MNILIYNDFEKIATEEIPLIDVRAPIEFAKGAFKNAINLPLMNDEERRLVGICYKEKGSEEALKLGHQLVCGQIRKERIEAWASHLDKYPASLLYCFRGGLRSQIAQQWITEATGKRIQRLEGGYKAFRNYLITQLEPQQLTSTPLLLGGYTGSGKTILLQRLKNAIDLEGIGNHRGSAFGLQMTPQPSQINFENNLAYALIQHQHKGYPCMVLEDEGAHVGRCFIPKALCLYLKKSPLIILETPLEDRVRITLDEYVRESQKNHQEVYSDEKGVEEWATYIRQSIHKIKKRLGGELYHKIMNAFEEAYQDQKTTGSVDEHKSWIRMLLEDYYDPMYRHQIQKVEESILFRGNSQEVFDYLQSK